tara:strand:+ start:552 stop:1349 length:798 start_codon:yes stop_codon:yes gene_type:complete
MAFKMKGPSTHKGTLRHKVELKNHAEQLKLNRSMDKTSLPDGRPGSSPAQFKPTMGKINLSLKPKKKSLLGADKLAADLKKKSQEINYKMRTANMSKKRKKKYDKDLAADKKYIEDLKKKTKTKTENKNTTEKNKVSTDKKKVSTGTNLKAQRKKELEEAKKKGEEIRDKEKHDKKIAKAMETKEERRNRRRNRNKKIADALEYIFLDGQRPDKAEASRRAENNKQLKNEQKLREKEKKQNKHTLKDDPKDNNKIYSHEDKKYKI